jgi:hypothetical protein
MNAFVVSGLGKRRAELAGEIEPTHEALRKCGPRPWRDDAQVFEHEDPLPHPAEDQSQQPRCRSGRRLNSLIETDTQIYYGVGDFSECSDLSF